nr:urea ABC transporter permease subunit UrtB [Roseicitreum antarcticum]
MLRPMQVVAQDTAPDPALGSLQSLLQDYQEEVASPSRQTVSGVLDALIAAEIPGTPGFLRSWDSRALYERPDDGLFFYATENADGTLTLIDIDTEDAAGTVTTREVNQIRPNAGVRRVIGAVLVQFELSDDDPALRLSALESITRSPDPEQIPLLAASIPDEPDAAILLRKERLLALLTARFGETAEARIAAIDALGGDISIEARGALNLILGSTTTFGTELPAGGNIAREIEVGTDLGLDEAYDQLVADGLFPPRPTPEAMRAALQANVDAGAVGGVPVHQLDTIPARERAYEQLEADGLVPPLVTDADVADAVSGYVFYEVYAEDDPAITTAAQDALAATQLRLGVYQGVDLGLDALSLASIFFLAAIGLAITFGVMGVINMAHGEFIMMGAYTGYVVQLFIPDYTLSLLVALPLAFMVTFGAGVAMERLVIRHLYKRPLETLLATFGISIALQQLAKNIFGTQARPLTAPDWLSGALTINDIIGISNIRIAIFVMALIFLGLLLFVLKRTRLGLEVRAVTQNPGMAASMGINPDRINMLTFGLGSGIAGIAGVAIGLYAQVTSEMGANYIVQSFMTVVVGGVGNVWGTLAGASLIGFLQKGIEWFNPSNTLAAQTYMILFIILFIQFRPKGIVALKGRAAGD